MQLASANAALLGSRWLERNSAWVNNYMVIVLLVLLSNMDIQKINTFDALVGVFFLAIASLF